jgi:Late competence development protein ComFB
MQGCKNAIEDIVLAEASLQLTHLPLKLQQEVQLNEVVCYALNRLPPMYATTQRGWTKLRERARKELRERVQQGVRNALLAVRRDQMRVADRLPETELDQVSIALSQLQELLKKSDLTWVEAPHVVYQELAKRRLKLAVSNTYEHCRSLISSKIPSSRSFSSSNLPQIKNREYTNVLEKLVLSISESQLRRLQPELIPKVSLYEVVAYALNRLLPMYATSGVGLQSQRQRAKAELSTEIIKTVRKAVIAIANQPERSLTPLPFIKMQANQENALIELKEILKTEDLDFSNLALAVAKAMEKPPSDSLV